MSKETYITPEMLTSPVQISPQRQTMAKTLDGCMDKYFKPERVLNMDPNDILAYVYTPMYLGMYTYYASADTIQEAQEIVERQQPQQYDFDDPFKSALVFSSPDNTIKIGQCHCSRDTNIPNVWTWSEDPSPNWNNNDWACAAIDLTNHMPSVVRLTFDKPSNTIIVMSNRNYHNYDVPDKDESPTLGLTKIYDPKPSREVFQDACNDIETVKEWYSIGDVRDVKMLRNSIKCYNTSHGLDILIKLLAIEGLEITMAQAVGIILHDVCKYKEREEVIEMLMSYYLKRPCDEIANHGINSAILILSAFPEIKCPDMLFVFRHAKKNPYKSDADKLTLFEKAFFIFDDVIKDIKHFKHVSPKHIWTDLNKFFQQPKLKMIESTFELTKSLNYKK